MVDRTMTESRTWTLIGRDGKPYESSVPGTLGGHRGGRIYGRLDCRAAWCGGRASSSPTRPCSPSPAGAISNSESSFSTSRSLSPPASGHVRFACLTDTLPGRGRKLPEAALHHEIECSHDRRNASQHSLGEGLGRRTLETAVPGRQAGDGATISVGAYENGQRIP